MNKLRHAGIAGVVRRLTSGQITVGLREDVIVVLCAIGIAVLGAVLLS